MSAAAARRTWTVPATVLRVIDGDTFTAALDLGWDVWLQPATVRLAAVDCPEKVTAAGRLALDRTRELLPLLSAVTVLSHSRDKYGRVLASVTLADGRDLAGVLLAEGHAISYDGGPRKG